MKSIATIIEESERRNTENEFSHSYTPASEERVREANS